MHDYDFDNRFFSLRILFRSKGYIKKRLDYYLYDVIQRTKNFIDGKTYRCLAGHTFKIHKFCIYYNAGLIDFNEPVKCHCGKDVDLSFWFRKKLYNPVISLALSMVHNPAFIWENGKKRGITNLREAKEHAIRNNLVFGGDDLEQESAHQRKLKDDQYTNQMTDRIMDDIKRREILNG